MEIYTVDYSETAREVTSRLPHIRGIHVRALFLSSFSDYDLAQLKRYRITETAIDIRESPIANQTP